MCRFEDGKPLAAPSESRLTHILVVLSAQFVGRSDFREPVLSEPVITESQWTHETAALRLQVDGTISRAAGGGSDSEVTS